ncbi:hypothetical protein GCM10009824_02750 [Kocuria atrinae]|uniref:Uncharacterized protein n=1 Tax=Kocuria atrinae TaxID=592377 RepID=A0ABN2XDF1_9MICC
MHGFESKLQIHGRAFWRTYDLRTKVLWRGDLNLQVSHGPRTVFEIPDAVRKG